ncbi:MAG: class I SAM-dependent methyltransferase [bacterium]|nr:class I SAM-dependent methyltransferase [bacterium]
MQEKITFSFGKNWQNFLISLSEDKFRNAKLSLTEFLGLENMQGKSFLDVGCGSGLFSYAAFSLGADKIVSFDLDTFSVECCRHLRKKANNPENWEVFEGSVVNNDFISRLGKFDIVYAWGVLHHTGRMWEAINSATDLVKLNGLFGIAIYNQTLMSNFWLKYKRLYNKSRRIKKSIMVWIIFLPRVLARLIKFKHPFKEKRGMSIYYDAVDWAGGFPYEFAPYKEVCSYIESRGFDLLKCNRTNSIGCNEFLFKRIVD